MQLTKQELNELMAEIVGPDYFHAWYVRVDWDPCTDEKEALQCLKAWCKANNGFAYLEVSYRLCPSVCLTTKDEEGRSVDKGWGEGGTLATAACLALASAVKGEQVELKV